MQSSTGNLVWILHVFCNLGHCENFRLPISIFKTNWIYGFRLCRHRDLQRGCSTSATTSLADPPKTQWRELSYAGEIESTFCLCGPLKAWLAALLDAIAQIEIDEHLVADTALLRKLLEVRYGGLGHINCDLLFEQFGVWIFDAAAEVV